MQKRTILITGGAGFVGGYACRAFLEQGWSVFAIDDLSNGKRENVPPEAIFFECDISSLDSLRTVFNEQYDCVLHCAAQSSNAISFEEPKRDLEINQTGTLNLLELCVQKDIPRFLFTSSMSVYGDVGTLPTPSDCTTLPLSFYAVHKLAAEHYIRIFAKQYGLKTTIFRLYTTYGFGQNLENINQGLLSIYLSYIVQKKPIVVKGSKDRTRDIIHVSDVVRAILLSIDNENSYGKIYNLGTGRGLTIEKILELLTTGMGYGKGEYPIMYEGPTAGDPMDTCADIQFTRKDLEWEPSIFAEEGIRQTVALYGGGRGR